MTQKSQTHMHLAQDVAARSDAVQLEIAPEVVGVAAPRGNRTQQILAATYWFDPEPRPSPYPVTIRFSGHRVDVKEQHLPGDQFVRDEKVEHVIPGSGPISVTTRIRNMNAGEWAVTAHLLQESQALSCEPSMPPKVLSVVAIQEPLVQFWRRWAPSTEEDKPVKTCLIPLARIPGILPGIWGVMVILGMVIALVIQSLVMNRLHLAAGSSWLISLAAILAGVIGARVWYIVLYRRITGWCIQGFIVGASLMATLLLVMLHIPAGAFLDATAPGLLIAMAVGRIGCFFGGCCGGPLTASRWGVWSSDQRVGARRIPTQLLELALAGILGLGTLAGVLAHGAREGAFFIGSVAIYTFVRQGILYLRAEQYKRRKVRRVTVALAALLLMVVAVSLAR